MDALTKHFDHYVINARLKPIFFALMPLAITTLAWCPKAQELGGIILTFMITFGVMAFLSNLVSNFGNDLQVKLFETWGGAPTTALLRHRDNTLEVYSKMRYHNWLQLKVSGLVMPSSESEVVDPINADYVYTSAASFLREYTRDKTKFPMIYNDNVAYGFARNLLVLKPLGIGLNIATIFINIFILSFYFIRSELVWMDFVVNNISMIIFGFGAILSSLILLLAFAVGINEAYVYGRAVRYSKSLLAACDISNNI